MHRRLVVGLAAALTLAGACGDDGDSAAPTTTTTEATTTTTQVEATTTTTTVEDESPPELDNTGDDYVAIFESLSEYGNWLDQHPSVEGLEQIYVPGSPAYEAVRPVFDALVSNGWRWDGPTARNEEVVFGDPIDARSVTVIAVERAMPATLLDDSGAPLPEQPPSAGDGRVLVQLAQGLDGLWRIASVELLERFG